MFLQCNDDDNKKPEEPNYGVEYFECKVNGEPFATVSHPFSCNALRFSYYPEAYLSSPPGYAVLRGRNCDTRYSVAIRIDGLQHKTGILNFNQPAFADSIYPFYKFPVDSIEDNVVMENLIDGEMNIEEFIPREDGSGTPYGSIKGTFNFMVTGSTVKDTFKITEGRFRFDVPQIF